MKMPVKEYAALPGHIQTEDELWNEICQMSFCCPFTRNFVRQVEQGDLTREQATIRLARVLIIDRKRLVEELVMMKKMSPPPVYIIDKIQFGDGGFVDGRKINDDK